MISSIKSNLQFIFKSGPILFLYILSFTELETEFSNFYISYFSFNLQLIIIYFWVLKSPDNMGAGHIFFAGIINDVVLGLTLGTSPLSFLSAALVATYVRNATLRSKILTDWIAFIPALILSYLITLYLILNYSYISFDYIFLLKNYFFTFLVFPIFYIIFINFNQFINNRFDA